MEVVSGERKAHELRELGSAYLGSSCALRFRGIRKCEGVRSGCREQPFLNFIYEVWRRREGLDARAEER